MKASNVFIEQNGVLVPRVMLNAVLVGYSTYAKKPVSNLRIEYMNTEILLLITFLY